MHGGERLGVGDAADQAEVAVDGLSTLARIGAVVSLATHQIEGRHLALDDVGDVDVDVTPDGHPRCQHIQRCEGGWCPHEKHLADLVRPLRRSAQHACRRVYR